MYNAEDPIIYVFSGSKEPTVGHAGATDLFMCISRMVISGTDK